VSTTHFARRFGVPGFLVRHPFRTDRVLPGIAAAGVPILIMHSREEEIIPIADVRRLGDLVPSARLVELTGGHNDMTLNHAAYEEAIDDLIRPLRARTD
jgi:pimeloyl-ACP methyl ester carboxylesterase